MEGIAGPDDNTQEKSFPVQPNSQQRFPRPQIPNQRMPIRTPNQRMPIRAPNQCMPVRGPDQGAPVRGPDQGMPVRAPNQDVSVKRCSLPQSTNQTSCRQRAPSPPSPNMQVKKQSIPELKGTPRVVQDQPAEPKLICRYPIENSPKPGIPGTKNKDEVPDYTDYESYMYMYEGRMFYFHYNIIVMWCF